MTKLIVAFCNFAKAPRKHLWIFLVNKTNRRTEFQFYLYYYSTCFGQPFCPSSGVLSHTSALVHFMQFDRLLPGVGWNCVPFYYSWWWAERLPGTRRVVIPIKLEFGASVGFIHKEYVTFHPTPDSKRSQLHKMYQSRCTVKNSW